MDLLTLDHKLKTRLIAGALVGVAALVLLSAALGHERIRQQRDLEEHAQLLADGLEAAMEVVPPERQLDVERALAARFTRRKKLVGIAVFDAGGRPLAASPAVPVQPAPPAVAACLKRRSATGAFETLGRRALYVQAVPFSRGGNPGGALAVFFDASYIEARVDALWRSNVQRWAIQGVVFVAAMLAMKLIFG